VFIPFLILGPLVLGFGAWLLSVPRRSQAVAAAGEVALGELDS
jgi:F0F1-type ATP synthase assembly protein I